MVRTTFQDHFWMRSFCANFRRQLLMSRSNKLIFVACGSFFSALGVAILTSQIAFADLGVMAETKTDLTFAKYGVTGKGVIIAILDRGIDYTHPDFRNADGTTRIRAMWDLSGENLCSSGSPIAYTQAQINTALHGTPLAERDAVGHGTVTTGIAAGNGSAFAAGKYAGIAPQADLVIVKVTSEGAPAHGTQAAEAPFQGCYDQALDLASGEATTLGEPIVALINSGTQWGPIDGTSAVSRRINLDFALTKPGRAYVSASGDEGTFANHAAGNYSTTATNFTLTKANTAVTTMQLWYTGSRPANVSIRFADTGVLVGPVPPGASLSKDGITIFHYNPGTQFYPWQSSGPDRAVWLQIAGHSGPATITMQGTMSGTGHINLYGDSGANITFPSTELTPGRLSDYSATASAIVTGCYNVRTAWTDIDGIARSITNQGATHALWLFSSGGPTRDGRTPPNGGVDLATPGGNLFAAYGRNSYWETFRFNQVQDGGGWYGRQSATSGASPITVGAIALLLQMNPTLTGGQIRTILHNNSTSDTFTGAVPNSMWGFGKLNVLAAANAVAAAIPANPVLSRTSLTFPSQRVGTVSAPASVMLSNTGTAALKITSLGITGDYHIENTTTCAASLAAHASCNVVITFRPKATGLRSGAATIKDINLHSPQTITLSGTGS
jgi:subtilisin family serine protease